MTQIYFLFSISSYFIYHSDDPSGTKMLLNLFFGSADENKTKYLFAAAEKCKPKVAKMLIQNGANPNDNSGADKWQALHVVTYNGNQDFVNVNNIWLTQA